MARLEVAAVIEKFGHPFVEQHAPSTYHLRTLRALRDCRTEAMGAHVDSCTHCGHIKISYNSCRNRHCPKCQGEKKQQWIENRSNDLLPVPYYHVVFTLPDTLNAFCLQHPSAMYNLLFKCAWDTLYAFALDDRYLGALPGMIAILHTWGQTLSLHPHLHCLVPAGGVSITGKWLASKYKGNYLFPVVAMSKVFRGKYIDHFKRLCKTKNIPLPKQLINQLYQHNWVVYSKAPYKTVHSVLEYLARYTHRIAISNHRIKSITDTDVVFTYKDYRQQGTQKNMSLSGVEFLRRFAMHILPKGFVRVRHYGFLSNAQRITLEKVKRQLRVPTYSAGTQAKPKVICPICKHPMVCIATIAPTRGPPLENTSWKIILHRN